MDSGKNEITTKMSSNEFTPTKMEKPVRVMIKKSKKVAVGERLAKWNRENKKKLKSLPRRLKLRRAKLTYSVGAVIAVVVLGLLSYYIYQSNKVNNNNVKVTPVEVKTRADKFENG